MAGEGELQPLVLLEDEPVPSHEVDELRLLPFAKVVAGAAVGTRGPFTIGVFADWGQGKTSVLRQAKGLVEADIAHPDVVTVWFNAWQYEREEHPIVPLIASIVGAVERKRVERGNDALEAVRQGWASMSRALRAVAYGFSAKAKVKVPGFAEVEAGFIAKEMIEREERLAAPDDPLLERSVYYNAFETLAELSRARVSSKEGPKIVVFIDDLDRCLPPQGLALLESIKLVLAQPGFIFVLAVDRRILEGYLAKRYQEEFGVAEYASSGTSYLDKIVQLPLPLPPHRSRFESFIDGLLKRDLFAQPSNQPVKEALQALKGVLAIGSNYNPRSLVRFVNNLIVDHSVWASMGEQVDADRLALCAVSRILQQPLGDHLFGQLARSSTLCEEIATGAEGREPLHERLFVSTETALGPRERFTKALLARLEKAEFLERFLQTAPGRRWLMDPEARFEVNEFLVEQREEKSKTGRSQRQIIDDAIRTQLHKPSDWLVTEEARRGVILLDLKDSDLSDEGVAHLSGLTALEALDLGGTQISDVGLARLSGSTGLQWLDVSRTQVSDAGLMHLRGFADLYMLDLSDTQVSDVGLVHLSRLTTLRELCLNNTQVADAGLAHLSGLTALRELYLGGTQVGGAGLAYLSELSALRVLYLGDTEVGDAGLAHLSGLSRLERVSLSRTQVGDAGLTHLSRLTELEQLYLMGTNVGDAGLVRLSRLITLQILDLGNTRVGDPGLVHLSRLTRLMWLNLSDTKAGDTGVRALKDALPQCSIRR